MSKKHRVQENRAATKKQAGTATNTNDQDIQDSPKDTEKLQARENIDMEMPDVRDIPGQEHIVTIGPLGEMADTTISSDDEEGIRDGDDLLTEEEENEDETR
jgi:hypothetical protein